MKDCDREGEGFLNWLLTSVILICIISIVVALSGCASMPGPPQATPMLAAQGTNPNCVFWCHVIITTAKAESDVQSDGTAPITTGSQTIDLDSTMSSSKSTDVGPQPWEINTQKGPRTYIFQDIILDGFPRENVRDDF